MSKGLFVWFDLMTPDVDTARAFYGAVFDWSIQPHAPSYAMIHVAGRPCGGIAARPGGPALWVPYVSTDDIAETVDTAEEIGGSVRMRHKAPGVGELAVLADRRGAAHAVIQLEQEGDAPRRVHGRDELAWCELRTDDLRDALDFHVALHDWTHTSRDPDHTVLGGGVDAAITLAAPGESPHWRVHVDVADLDVTVRRVVAHGGRVVQAPADVPGVGRVAVFEDPAGAVFGAVVRR